MADENTDILTCLKIGTGIIIELPTTHEIKFSIIPLNNSSSPSGKTIQKVNIPFPFLLGR